MIHQDLTYHVAIYRFPAACLVAVLSMPAAAFQQALPSSSVALLAVTAIGPVARTTPLRDPEHGYPYNATPMDLAKHGYVEEEFYFKGNANSYNTPPGQAGSVKNGRT
jgi:hypothetical protein